MSLYFMESCVPLRTFFLHLAGKGVSLDPPKPGLLHCLPHLRSDPDPFLLSRSFSPDSPWNSPRSLPSSVSGHRCGGKEVAVPQCLERGWIRSLGRTRRYNGAFLSSNANHIDEIERGAIQWVRILHPKYKQSLQIRTTHELLWLGRRKTVQKLSVLRK